MRSIALHRRFFIHACAMGWIAASASAQGVAFTGMVRRAADVELRWSSPAMRHIVSAGVQPAWQYAFVSPVVTGSLAVVGTHPLPAFYRVQRVHVVEVADPNVELGIRNAIVNKAEPTEDLYDFETILVTNLVPAGILINKNVTVLTGLECTSLQSLNLSLNPNLSDLLPLAGLTDMTRLDLLDNSVSDLSPLSNLTRLGSLEFPQNFVSSLAPLSGMTNLTRLSMFDNLVSDLSPISGYTNLEQLLARDNLISDLSPLSGLVKLTDLRLENNQIEDLTPLAGLTQLFICHLSDNNIDDLAPLADLTGLAVLRSDRNVIADVTPLSGLTNLVDLRLIGNQIEEIGGLVTNSLSGGLGTGDVVRLQGNPLSDFARTNDIPVLTNRGVNVLYDP